MDFWDEYLQGRIVIRCNDKEEHDDLAAEASERGIPIVHPVGLFPLYLAYKDLFNRGCAKEWWSQSPFDEYGIYDVVDAIDVLNPTSVSFSEDDFLSVLDLA